MCETTTDDVDCAVFFELKHFKAKKKKISTKCWSFMEKDEIKPGSKVLEMYEIMNLN